MPFLRPPEADGMSIDSGLKLGDEADIEIQARALLEDTIGKSGESPYSLPLQTQLAAVKVAGERITVDFVIPPDFIRDTFDAAGSDAINRTVVETLLPLGLRDFQVRAADENGEFLPLSDLLPEVKTKAQVSPKSSDPLIPNPGPLPGAPGGAPLTKGDQPPGILSGKTVWLSAGHGWVWTGIRWATQRPNTYGIVEDLSNAEAVNYYLARYLWNAGADVRLVRERSHNQIEVIVDNDQGASGYSETGQFSTSSSRGYQGGTYRYTVSEQIESASATWRPDLPKAGLYPVWVWYRHNVNRTAEARYQVHHAGGQTQISISQEVHGDTWHYLGEFYFDAGTGGYITLTNQSSDPGQAVIADAVRFGGGMGSIDRGQGVSGKPRWEEAARYYAQYMGFPMDESINDVIVRPLYAEWEKSKGYPQEEGVFISWHTNCCNKSGTLSFTHSFKPTPGSLELQSNVHNELVRVLRAGWDPDWQDQGQMKADFGEVRELSSMPGVLLEVAYHDTETPGDADDLKEPRFRQLAARGVYQGIVKYFAELDGLKPEFVPEAPTHLAARNSTPGKALLSWQAPPGAAVSGAEAAFYKVYRSENGRGFDGGVITSEPFYTVSGLQPGSLYFFRVTALNQGGESFPSKVAALRTPRSGTAVPFLIVDGFDRLDKDSMLREIEDGSMDSIYRMPMEQMDRDDYIVEHALALGSCGYAFDSALNEALEDGSVDPGDYAALDWFVGEDAQVDRSLSKVERAFLQGYLDGGGNLLISGSEIGWDLARPGGGADEDFYQKYLKSEFLGTDAGTYYFKGSPADMFNGLSGGFDDSSHGLYDVDKPDRLAAHGGSHAVLEYLWGIGDDAALAYNDEFGLVYFGFPLETVIDPIMRSQLICRAAEYLIGPAVSELYMPAVVVDK